MIQPWPSSTAKPPSEAERTPPLLRLLPPRVVTLCEPSLALRCVRKTPTFPARYSPRTLEFSLFDFETLPLFSSLPLPLSYSPSVSYSIFHAFLTAAPVTQRDKYAAERVSRNDVYNKRRDATDFYRFLSRARILEIRTVKMRIL